MTARKLMLAAALAATTSPAGAHSWYPYECCSDNDCQRIKPSMVKEKDGGFEVTVRPGEHKMTKDWTEAKVYHVTYKQTRPSEDGHFHLCLSPTGVLLCFFAAAGGA